MWNEKILLTLFLFLVAFYVYLVIRRKRKDSVDVGTSKNATDKEIQKKREELYALQCTIADQKRRMQEMKTKTKETKEEEETFDREMRYQQGGTGKENKNTPVIGAEEDVLDRFRTTSKSDGIIVSEELLFPTFRQEQLRTLTNRKKPDNGTNSMPNPDFEKLFELP